MYEYTRLKKYRRISNNKSLQSKNFFTRTTEILSVYKFIFLNWKIYFVNWFFFHANKYGYIFEFSALTNLFQASFALVCFKS